MTVQKEASRNTAVVSLRCRVAEKCYRLCLTYLETVHKGEFKHNSREAAVVDLLKQHTGACWLQNLMKAPYL